MKTLVIHPFDLTTGFLSDIYEEMFEWTVIDQNVSKKFLKEQISNHDRIIMLGHGSENGLFGFNKIMIDSKLVYLLREKQCICIWCNADKFVEKYKLKGFYTGMIISDEDEAINYNVDGRGSLIFESNQLFSSALKYSITSDNILEMMLYYYVSKTNPVVKFNRVNLYQI